ncbi:formate dehydrogenase accessory sulfurtransferase FdhD [Noviherbaspirillum sp.]|jgi:FdhD protein|uniref:formate dehydrogenase accessory sulfurtransferase FdhD n=1 Tax=Noviherbaspirillum sp. TaxID=1926288 RepID=UPI0025E39E3E|nr:formate dehydrogenase accessory sulfurtransferase FdhD [Noviherbaspirillum sp.]
MNAISIAEDDALREVAVDRWEGAAHQASVDTVAVEVPVALEYNGVSHAVMLASPEDLEDFALGFSLSECILANPSELYECEVSAVDGGVQVQMRIATERFMALKERRRNLAGRTGCGLCGAESLQQVVRDIPPVRAHASFPAAALHSGMAAMQLRQRMQRHSGATHAAAWLNAKGEIDIVREDVGRHNALDKLIGALARQQIDVARGAALITSRASYEMVQKAATAGIGMLAAISAPTSLAVQLAEQAQLTLLGFVRDDRHVVYAHPQRIQFDKEYRPQ